MDFLLLLLGIIFVAVICTAARIVTGRKQPLVRQGTRRLLPPSHSTAPSHPPLERGPELRSISIKECETLIRSSGEVLFVAVNETGHRRPLPFHNMYALNMTPRQFADEVRWFPANTCVVLCGDVNLCSLALGLLENVPEIPLIYMLRDRSSRLEIA